MTYPPPRYLGDSGEITATFRSVGEPPELTYPSGGTAHYLATGATTKGQFGLYRWEMPAEPSGPEPHFHRSISESFYVLAGSVRIFNGARWIDTVPGDFVHVPEGGVHGFRNESGEPASMLIQFCPGAPREAYFEDLLGLVDKSEEEKAEFFLRHDTFWV
ncbi:quercetin dioxygenase-like cupin family protein [Allocatelliglobosispora scoriae]|uniref:Quercetin dioxygenase-like cupin family protein n=1 Tax=Allocatelliglobosispora scoriae TaxID=643052 RepID=A0A841C2G5_9ACTN|nr:cupin domain-containing protein [Allocatelliglobosispora scoriae]MBB5873242.1 quercetin dioxygenase-like cupin family protein [Allocatelliglobosispora scoriae]